MNENYFEEKYDDMDEDIKKKEALVAEAEIIPRHQLHSVPVKGQPFYEFFPRHMAQVLVKVEEV